MRDDIDARVQCHQVRPGCLGLACADFAGGEQHLALQVAQLDVVVVHQAQGSNASRGQVQRGRRPKAAGTNDQHGRGCEALLTGKADLRQRQVSCITLPVTGVEGPRLHPGESLPLHRGVNRSGAASHRWTDNAGLPRLAAHPQEPANDPIPVAP